MFGVPAGFSSNGEPWVWADPRLSFLGPFWVRALAITSIVILVHRHPGWTPREAAGEGDGAFALDRWSLYNRAAMTSAEAIPTLVLSYEGIVDDPVGAAEGLRTFLSGNGVELAGTEAGSGLDRTMPKPVRSGYRRGRVAPSSVAVEPGSAHAVLHNVLCQMERHRPPQEGSLPGEDVATLVESTVDFYSEPYFRHHEDESLYKREHLTPHARVAQVADRVARGSW